MDKDYIEYFTDSGDKISWGNNNYRIIWNLNI